MAPSTEPFCEMSFLVWACHRNCSPSSAKSTTACKHACGLMMESAWISSTRGKVSGKDACLGHCCSTCFSRRYRVWPRNASFLADAAITENMVQLQQKKEKGKKKGTSRTGKVDGRRGQEEEEVRILWGMLYGVDASIALRSSEGLERMMTMIVTTYSSFALTVSEAKTAIMCLETKGEGKVSFTNNAAGEVYKQAIEFGFLGGAITADRDLSIEMTRGLQRAWAFFLRYKMEIYDRPGVR